MTDTKDEKINKDDKAFASINLKSFLMIAGLLILFVITAGVLSYFVPQGEFLRDETGTIIPDTYQKGSVQGIAFWRVLTAPFRVFFSSEIGVQHSNGSFERRDAFVRRYRLKFKYGGTGEKGVVNVIIRIFGSRCNERNPAVLHKFKKRLLLLFVKGLYFVKIKERAVFRKHILGACQYLLYVRNGCGRCVKHKKLHSRYLGYNFRNGCLSRPGRAVKNQIRNSSSFGKTA